MKSGKKSAFSKPLYIGVCAILVALITLNGPVNASPRYRGPSTINTTGCSAASGKINGRGATFQTSAQVNAFAPGYDQDICGSSGLGMVQYNYPASAGNTGSGNGQKAVSCRTDPFGGTDIPYNLSTLAQLNGAPGATGGCAISFTPPNPPNTAPYPDPADQSAQMMSFPVAASAVALAYNLPASACGGVQPATIQLTAQMVSLLAGGEITSWSDPRLRTGGLNPGLANCTTNVQRVVRLDRSGTTQIYKNYLQKADPARSGATCDGTHGWTFYAQDANNTSWPGTGTCAPLLLPATSGNAALATLCASTTGCFSYLDLADSSSRSLAYAEVRNATDTSFQSPVTFKPGTASLTQANCDLSLATLPGSTPSDAVGLNPSDNWASDNPSGNHGDVTNVGSAYPISGLTFAMVYKNLFDTSSTAIARLSADQRHTLYQYFSYVLSKQAQERLGDVYYAPLPLSWRAQLVAGFQSNSATNIITAHVTFQGRSQPSDRSSIPVTATIRDSSSATVYDFVLNTDTSGNVRLPVNLASGTYTLRVKSAKYLATAVPFTYPSTAVEVGLLRAGDANNSNIVNTTDFNILKTTFGKGIGDTGYDDRADFNGDGIVNSADFNLQKGNFGLSGAP